LERPYIFEILFLFKYKNEKKAPDGSLVGLPFLVGCAGVRKWLWERGEKSQASLNSQPASNRDAICAIFLLGGFADTQFAWPYCHRVIRELVF